MDPVSLILPNVARFCVPSPTWFNVSPVIYPIFGLVFHPKHGIHSQTQCVGFGNFLSIIWHFDGFFSLMTDCISWHEPSTWLQFTLKAYLGHWLWKLPGSVSGNSLMMGLSKAIGIVAPLPSSVVPNRWPAHYRWPMVRGFPIKRLPVMILLQCWNLGALDICLPIR